MIDRKEIGTYLVAENSVPSNGPKLRKTYSGENRKIKSARRLGSFDEESDERE